MSQDFSKQLFNFISALVALAPSRNYITQLLYLIRINGNMDYRVLEAAYPELMKDEYTRESLAQAFDIEFSGEKVSLNSRGFGWSLTELVERILALFDDAEFRSRVSALLKNEYPEGIPNLLQEWVDVRLKGLLSEPTYGKLSIKVLKEVVRLGRAKREELEKAMGVSTGDMIQCLSLLETYKLVEKDTGGSYRPTDGLRKYSNLLEVIEV